MDNAWLNDTLPYLSYHYTAYRLVLNTDGDICPASLPMIRAFQDQIDDGDLPVLALAEIVS